MARTSRSAFGLALLFGLSACDQRPTAPPSPATLGPGEVAVASIMTASRASHTPPPYAARGAARATGGAAMLSMTSGTDFVGLFRYPAEEQAWMIMDADTAYFRDAFVSGDEVIADATDGQTWYAKAIGPNGVTVTWATMTFRASYNGEDNCFVTSSWYLCGGDYLYIQWYMTSQCLPSGNWKMQFFHDGQLALEKPFFLKPSIPPGKVPLKSQLTYATTQYSNYCTLTTDRDDRHLCDGREGEVKFTIKQLGCALTSAAMTLAYHGVDVDPATLNTWLREHNGYSKTRIDFAKVAEYGRTVGGREITYLGKIQVTDTAALRLAICQYGPQPINVTGSNGSPTGHFVAATGRDLASSTFLINDPAGGVERTLRDRNYTNTHAGRRVFSGPQYHYDDPYSGIRLFFHSPGELLITDGQGRRTGYDPVANVSYDEIPGASYDSTTESDPEDPNFASHTVREFELMRAPAGNYTVTVTGTGTGTYMLDMRTASRTNAEGNVVFADVPISPGVTHRYSFQFDPASTAGGAIPVGGGFPGGGQSSTVNAFLSYSAPAESQVALPAGTTSYPLMVFYGAGIDPATFTAELNGVSIASLFAPAPGGMNTVRIPLTSGRNVLILHVRGSNGSRMPRDADRFVFKVP